MNRDMQPLPGDDYMMLCLKLQAAAKLWNKAKREYAEASVRVGWRELTPVAESDAERETRALLDACIAAMGEPVLLGAAPESRPV